jgi:hypothetical protein
VYYAYNNNIEKGQDMQHTEYLTALKKYKEIENKYNSIRTTLEILQNQLTQTYKEMYKAKDNLIPIEHKYLKQLGFDSQNFSEWGLAEAELREGRIPTKEN